MRFGKLDLNLLLALEALLSERSVSVAADRICLSQSATSSALGRLRLFFNDELLVQKGRQMVLTARGEELLTPVRDVLQLIRTTITVEPEFNPLESDRTIKIMATDYALETLLSHALLEFAQTAPNMRFEICTPDAHLLDTLERGAVDLLMTIDVAVSRNHPYELLFEDDYVVVAWEGNAQLGQRMTAETYFELGHITTQFGNFRIPAFEDWYLRTQSLQRRVEVVAPTFLAVPFMLVGSQRIATMHRRLARAMAVHLPLRIMPLPFDIPHVRMAAQWHSSATTDKALAWVVSEFKRIAAPQNVQELYPNPPITDAREELALAFQASSASHVANYR